MTNQSLFRLMVPALLVMCLPASADECNGPVDFLQMKLPAHENATKAALETAYPGLKMDAETITLASGKRLAFEGPRDVIPAERLENATLGDMFTYIYPLDFQLQRRKAPFYDPGRVRNEAFFKAVFFANKGATQKSLAKTRFRGKAVTASFMVTKKHCVHVQLTAALNEIASQKPSKDKYFRKTGGSFNWRKISGTNRLSSHSFGSAVDINSQLGKYWKWSGVKPGKAARYDNVIPVDLVRAFERRGFIWGGKWHHFDGMHFEYRPELILYSRLMDK